MNFSRQFWVRAVLGVALLGVILWRADLSSLTAHLTPAVWPAVFLGVALLIGAQGLAALRWGLILWEPRPGW